MAAAVLFRRHVVLAWVAAALFCANGAAAAPTAALPAAAVPAAAQAQSGGLEVDLSDRVIEITTGFAGSSDLIFGATDVAGDVVLVVSGPPRDMEVRRRERRFGIWVNGPPVIFRQVPSFYAVLSSRPLTKIFPAGTPDGEEIGIDRIPLSPEDRSLSSADADLYRAALRRLKREEGLYTEQASVRFVGGHLFRTTLHYPAIVPVGEFSATVYLVRDGKVIDVKPTALTVRKVGVGAELYFFARHRAVVYGALSILAAAVAGWLASIVFRRT